MNAAIYLFRICLGAALCGAIAGVLGGALLGTIAGLVLGRGPLALDGAVWGGMAVALLGGIFGLGLGLYDVVRERRSRSLHAAAFGYDLPQRVHFHKTEV